MELAPGLHRIGNDLVAAYLVVDETGITVIDAGLGGHWNDLTRELKAIGRTAEDIRALILTHGDSDHVGFAERLRRDHHVPVYVHEADAARARGEEATKPEWGRMRAGAIVQFLGYTIAKGGLRTRYLGAVQTVSDGQVLDAPGSIAVHIPALDAVFVGDALTTRNVLTGVRGPQPAPFTDDPARAIESLERLRATGAKWVLPGHGAPWSGGVDAAVDAVLVAR